MKTSLLPILSGLLLLNPSTGHGQGTTNVPARGFVQVTVAAGQFRLLANPLIQSPNTLTQVLAEVPAGTQVFQYDAARASFREFVKQADSSWSGEGADAATLELGEGFFVKNDQRSEFRITFTGEVPQGRLAREIPAGYSLLASMVPQEGRLESELGLPAPPLSRVYLFRQGGYQQYTRRASGCGPVAANHCSM